MIIGHTELTVVEPHRETKVPVTIVAPVSRDAAWSTRWRIEFPESPLSGEAHGGSSLQSLVFGLQQIGAVLNAMPCVREGNLFAIEPGGGVGFPVPGNIREWLVGLDRETM